MLQTIFGDDEHTAADGPYARVMKTRKWLYLSAAVLAGFNAGLYREKEAESIVKFVKLPTDLISLSVALGLGYLIVQYILLALQLASTYDIILSERFTFRRSEELSAASAKISDTLAAYNKSLDDFAERHQSDQSDKVKSLRSAISEKNSELSKLITAKETLEAAGGPSQGIKNITRELRIKSASRSKLNSELKLVTELALSQQDQDSDPDVAAKMKAVRDAEDAFEHLKKQVPASRFGYRAIEIAIDVFRCAPPAILGLLALAFYI